MNKMHYISSLPPCGASQANVSTFSTTPDENCPDQRADTSFLKPAEPFESIPAKQPIIQRNAKAMHWSGSHYEQFSNSQRLTSQRLLDCMNEKGIPPHRQIDRVLDVGCGTGGDFQTFQERFDCDLYAIDKDPSMIEKASKKAKAVEKETGKRIHLSQQSAENFSLTERFPLILSVQVFHWLEKKPLAKALENIHGHLEDGGYLACVFATSKEGLPFHKVQTELMNGDKYKAAFIGFTSAKIDHTEADIEELLTHAQLKKHTLFNEYVDKVRPDLQELRGSLKAVSSEYSHLKHHHKELSEPFLDDLVRAYLREVEHHSEKEIPWKTPAMTLIAFKESTSSGETNKD